jgi:outer membrane biosynthesis protein TonB
MSDAGGSPDLPEYTPKPHGDGFWGRYLDAPTWVKVGIPLVVVALVLGVGVLIGQSGDGDSTSSSDQNTEELLALMAAKMAAEQAATTTVPETTTTEAETTTTEEATTTTVAETTTTAEATTVPETTIPETSAAATTVPKTTTTTVPKTTPTQPETTPSKPDTSEPQSDTSEPSSDTSEPSSDTSEPSSDTSEPPSDTSEPIVTHPIVIPPGALFASLEEFQSAWNSTAQGSSAGQIAKWTPIDVNGTQADMADIGGNLRVGAVVNGANGAVTQVALGWLPLTDDTQQAAQNAVFQDAFSVLIRTVNPGATAAEQSGLASDLGITDAEPPFPTGTTTRATLAPERYVLEAVDVPGYGPVTIVGARSSRAQ